MTSPANRESGEGGKPGSAKVVVATTMMLSFISFWRAAAIVLNDLGSSAYYASGIAEQAVGKAAPWFIFGVMLFSYAVRAVYVESCAMFTRGGVYRVVKEAMGGTLAKLSVSALMFDYVLTGPISGVSAGQYITGLIAQTATYFGHPWHPAAQTVNGIAAIIAAVITIYFWWRNTLGLHESSDDAMRIMVVTTVMVVLLIGWATLTIAVRPEAQRLPPAPIVRNLSFSKDAVGWFPKLIPHALKSAPAKAGEETHYNFVGHIGGILGLIGILMAFGHSFLAMSGEETLAQVNRELEHPKHKNLMRAGLVIFVYSLVFTSLVSFFAYSLIPDDVRPHYFDNMISGISMYLVGPMGAKLLFQAFIVVVGFLMLAGAINTSIIGANGVLNRVSEDGVMPDWLRVPHRRFGTSYRIINMIVVMQLVAIVGSRGDTYALGEAYAFGVVWSFAFKGLAMLVLRFRDHSHREWKVPGNFRIRGVEIPVILGVISLILFGVAIVNLISKQVATVSGIAFTAVFFSLFAGSEKLLHHRRKTAHVEMDQFQLQPQEGVSAHTVGVRPGNVLCYVRDYRALGHLNDALDRVDTTSSNIVVMTTQMASGPDVGYANLSEKDVFTTNEQLLFTKVVSVAERAGKHVDLLVVPANDADQAVAQTAILLGSSEILVARSPVMTADEQARRLGESWERVADKDTEQVRLRVVDTDQGIAEYSLGAHAPKLADRDVALIHELWLNLVGEEGLADIHHCDTVSLALNRLAQDLAGPERQSVLAQMCLGAVALPAHPEGESDGAAEVQELGIMVPILDAGFDADAVAVAAQIASGASGSVHLVYPCVVPRQSALVPPGPQERKEINARLSRLESGIRGSGARVERLIQPARDTAWCVINTAKAMRAGMIVLALPHECDEDLANLADVVARNAPCKLVILRHPNPDRVAS